MTNVTVGTMFVNSKDELCLIKSRSEHQFRLEILDTGNTYRVFIENFEKNVTKGRYKLFSKQPTTLGVLLYG